MNYIITLWSYDKVLDIEHSSVQWPSQESGHYIVRPDFFINTCIWTSILTFTSTATTWSITLVILRHTIKYNSTYNILLLQVRYSKVYKVY